MNAVLFACGGDVLATAGYDQSVRFWDCRSSSFDPIQVCSPFKDSVTSLALHDAVLTAGSVDGTLRRFDLRRGRVTVDELGAPVSVISLSADGALCLAALAGAPCLRLLDTASGRLLAQYEGVTNVGSRCGAALANADARVAAGGEDGSVCVWDLVSGRCEARIEAHPGRPVCGLACHPDGRAAMLTCSTDGLIRVWEAP